MATEVPQMLATLSCRGMQLKKSGCAEKWIHFAGKVSGGNRPVVTVVLCSANC
jgi:hypothetical protein